MTRDEAWVRFAAAAFTDPEMIAEDAALSADQLLKEYDKRWDRVAPVRTGFTNHVTNPDLRGNEK